MALDIKSITLVGGLISVVAGGGFYGLHRLYVKTMGDAAFTEVTAYGYVSECMMLWKSKDVGEIERFLKKIEANKDKLSKSDLILTALSLAAGETHDLPSGMGQPLATCEAELKTNLETLKRKQ